MEGRAPASKASTQNEPAPMPRARTSPAIMQMQPTEAPAYPSYSAPAPAYTPPAANGSAGLAPWGWIIIAGAGLVALGTLLTLPDLYDELDGKDSVNVTLSVLGSMTVGFGFLLAAMLGRATGGGRVALLIAGGFFLTQGMASLGMLPFLFGGLF